ncbi:MAG: hypothetical protein R2909_06595 [Gemmatimonadales bacterium]
MPQKSLVAMVLLATGCGLSDGRTRCGIEALAAPGLILDAFTRPGGTLAAAPEAMPEILPTRFAAGDAYRSVVGRTDSAWVIGVEGELPAGVEPGFGVLVVDPSAGAQGVVLFEGPPIPGAPVIGQLQVGAATVPVLGLRTPVAGFQEGPCPLFPDSLRT